MEIKGSLKNKSHKPKKEKIMKKIIGIFFAVMFAMIFVACTGGDYNEGDSNDGGGGGGDTNTAPALTIDLMDGFTCEKGDTITIKASGDDNDGNVVRMQIKADGSVLCGNTADTLACTWTCPAGLGTHSFQALGWDDDGARGTSDIVRGTVVCTDANRNGRCDNQERIAKYCYDHVQLDMIWGDTIHYGQFSSPNPTLGWEADNDVIQLLKGSDTVCFTSKAWPIVEHGYESIYGDVTAGKMAADKWIGYSVAPTSVEVKVGDTTTTRPILPYFSGMGYHTCLDEEAPLCWVNLCTIDTNGVKTCYDEVGAVDNACGDTKTCQLCVEHCRQLYDILLP